MITLYFAPRTRSIRIRWLLEELGLPYELKTVPFNPPSNGWFSQQTPLGKLPVIEDGDVTMGESGAILEYILERYGDGRLAPPIGAPLRGPFLQWIHFAEGTAFPPIGTIVWHTLYKGDAADVPTIIADAHERAHAALAFLERGLGDQDYLVGNTFSAADIMIGFTLGAASALGVLDGSDSRLGRYLARLQARPAFQKAVGDV